MTRSPTFSPAAENTTPPRTFGPAAPKPSPPGPTSPASPWRHNRAYRRASLSPSRFPLICTCQVDGAVTLASVTLGTRRDDNLSINGLLAASCGQQMELERGEFCRSPETRARNGGDRGIELGYSVAQFVEAVVPRRVSPRGRSRHGQRHR